MSKFLTSAIAPESSTTILIVEDSQIIRTIYLNYLQSDETLNYRILEAETVEQGSALWKTKCPDVVLVDFLLPDGDGLDLLVAMGQRNPDVRLPAILLTGEGDERIAVQAMKLGAMDYLVKEDVTAFSLCQSIRNLLDRKQAEAILQSTYEQLLRSNEALARANRLKDDFLSRISHELRTPLSSIKIAAQMLEIRLQPLGLLENESNSIKRYLGIIKEECQREIELITDLLDLTRLDTGMETLDLVPIKLQHFIPNILAPFHEQVHLQRQQLALSIPANLPTVTTDLSYLHRILHELVKNACKYTPPDGQISLTVEPGSIGIKIRVNNSGVEIPEQAQEMIFDRFYRMPNGDPWKHGGTGLGLALVKQLVQQIGGKISLESSHLNTCFILDLPWIMLSPVSPDAPTHIKIGS